jgi:hypothetical protein
VNEAEQNRLFQLQAENQRLQAKLAAAEKTIERLRQAWSGSGLADTSEGGYPSACEFEIGKKERPSSQVFC